MGLKSCTLRATTYLSAADLRTVPGWRAAKSFDVAPRAQGEYNMNYLVRQGAGTWVLRANTGSQIGRDDRILYEYRAL